MKTRLAVRGIGFVAGMLALASAGAGAQSAAAAASAALDARQGKAAAAVDVRYVVPEVPATTLLNASPANIARPTTTKDLLLALANGVNERGRLQQGFAIEASPYTLIPHFGITLQQYRRSRVAYVLSNLLASLATVAGADSTSTDIAFGLRTTVYDAGDPMRDAGFRVAVDRAVRQCAPASPPPGIPRPNAAPAQPGATPQPGDEAALKAIQLQEQASLACMDKATDKLAADYARQHWNAGRLVVAWAGGQRIHGTSLGSTTLIGNRLWLVGGVPLGSVAQAIASLDYAQRRSADTLPLVKAITYGARLNLGSDALNGFLEMLGQSRSSPPAGVKASSSAWTGGLEVRAANGLWLSTGFGKRFQEAAKPDRIVVLASVRWGLSSKPWLRPEGS